MTGDAFYDRVKARFDALNHQQRLNVWKRLSSFRAKISRSIWVFAVDQTITLELTAGRPEPDPCRSQVQPKIQEEREAAVAAVCLNSPRPGT